jgi:hypothetical protein
MNKNLKENIYIIITLLFVVLIFKNNYIFKYSIINGCYIFFNQVFPSLFPMMLINEILLSYNFIYYLNKIFYKPLNQIFNMSNAAIYIFLTSILSGTPTNGLIASNLIKNNNLNSKDASIILSYSFFLNPLFLINILNSIFNNTYIVLKLIIINYSINLIIALFYRSYKYQNINYNYKKETNLFSSCLSKSINHIFSVLINILGTIIFYFIICEGINIFVKNDLINCFINGLLEVTGGLIKLSNLNINYKLKEILAISFISFGGLSIYSQLKSTTMDTSINQKYFFKNRLIHALLATTFIIIIP